MVPSPSNSLQRRAGNMYALVLHVAPFPQPNASLPVVGSGIEYCAGGWTHRLVCMCDSPLRIHISSDDFRGTTSSSVHCYRGYSAWGIVHSCGMSTWVSMYYLPIALAHLGRLFASFALAKLHIVLYEIAKSLIVDTLYKKNLLHFLQIACIMSAINDTLVIQYEGNIQMRSQPGMNIHMQRIKWKELQFDHSSGYSAVMKLVRICHRRHQENEIDSSKHVRNLCCVYVAAFFSSICRCTENGLCAVPEGEGPSRRRVLKCWQVGLGRNPPIPAWCTNGQKSQILPKSCVPMALKS